MFTCKKNVGKVFMKNCGQNLGLIFMWKSFDNKNADHITCIYRISSKNLVRYFQWIISSPNFWRESLLWTENLSFCTEFRGMYPSTTHAFHVLISSGILFLSVRIFLTMLSVRGYHHVYMDDWGVKFEAEIEGLTCCNNHDRYTVVI